MKSSTEKVLLASGLCAALVAGVNALLDARTDLLLFDALAPIAAWSVALAAIALVRAHLARRAVEEEQDRARDATRAESAALFASGDTEPFSAARTAEHFDRFAFPAFSLLLAAGLGAWVWMLAARDLALAPAATNPLLAAAFLLGEAFALFLFSRYLIGLARSKEAAIARAPGIAIGIFALASFAGVVTALAAHLGFTQPDRWLYRLLIAAIAALAAEQVVWALVSLYVPARRRAPTIESRLGAFLTDPAAWTRSIASSLDYQFGVQAGHDAMRRFLRRALLPLVLIQALLMYALSCFVFIAPHESGIRERWGRPLPDRWLMESGFHFKAPWPFETVKRFPSKRILRVEVGYKADAHARRPDAILWTVPHYADEDVFVAAARAAGQPNDGEAVSVSLVSLNMPIEYRITNLLDHAYRHRDPATLLRDSAYRAVTRALAHRDLLDLLGADRLAFGETIRAALQTDADRHGLGVEILFVGVQGIHPPVMVADAFQSVIGALEQKEANILGARAYAASIGPRATAEAERRCLDAEADRAELRERAGAEAELFTRLIEAHAVAPQVVRQDLQLTALAEALARRPFTVVAHRGAKQVLYFDLKKPALPELYELAPLTTGDSPP